ncbi:MAG: hypothetical protein J7K15_11480 [Deltaproteobacteria bacterium]|nr:hypothetical protein [Deltaproteobacteria bacterium]
MPRVLAFAEGNTRSSANGLDVKVHRSPQAVACRKRYAVELGRPQILLTEEDSDLRTVETGIRGSCVRRSVTENPW